jgi:neutral ceramidase
LGLSINRIAETGLLLIHKEYMSASFHAIFFLAAGIVCELPRSFGEELKAGAAWADITPKLGTPMAGYYSERGAEGVHDPLKAKALVLQSGGTKAALVTLDLISTLRSTVEEARRIIEQETGIPAKNVMISATHSHTGPVFSGSRRFDALGGSHPLAQEYTYGLPVLIARAVKEANEKLVPTRISQGTGLEDNLAFNRRFRMRDGSVGWNPGKLNPNILKPAGPTDPRVHVVCFETGKDEPIAAYVNFAMHLDTVGGTSFSADYPFTLSESLGRAKGPGMVTLFSIGCAGDINHINVKSPVKQQGNGEAARIGTILAANVLRTMEHLKTNPVSGLRISSEIARLPLPAFAPGDLESARKVADSVDSKQQPAPKFMEQVQAFKVLDVEVRQGKPHEVEVQVIALGQEIAWVSLPGEIFVELGMSIKAGSPFPQTIIAELANGSIGYIPTRRAYSEGNYEVVSARCAEGSGELLVESALRQLRKLFAESAGTATPP